MLQFYVGFQAWIPRWPDAWSHSVFQLGPCNMPIYKLGFQASLSWPQHYIVFSNLAHIISQYISLDSKLVLAGPYIGKLKNSRQLPLSPMHSYNPVTMVTTLIQSTFMFHIVLAVGFLRFTHRQSGIHAVN